MGYALLRTGRLQDAIEVFQLNVAENPTSGNVYDSLGEAYLVDDQLELAEANYHKSLEFDPTNNNARAMLEVIAERENHEQ